MKLKFLVLRKTIIKEFAAKIADLQRRADVEYYRDNPPKINCNDYASWLLDQTVSLRQMCEKMGIWDKVYTEAIKIYDFRNSGRRGYTLKDGKIVKELANIQEGK